MNLVVTKARFKPGLPDSQRSLILHVPHQLPNRFSALSSQGSSQQGRGPKGGHARTQRDCSGSTHDLGLFLTLPAPISAHTRDHPGSFPPSLELCFFANLKAAGYGRGWGGGGEREERTP